MSERHSAEKVKERVIIADDQPKVRFALRVLLENVPDVEIVGEADNGYDFFASVRNVSPTVIIMDWMLPGLTGKGSIVSLREICPNVYIIALSGRPELGQEALANGADTFISKIDPPDRLLEVIHNKPRTAGKERANLS